MRLPSPVEIKVVGLTYCDRYPEIVERIQPRIPLSVRLRREPDNPHDPNAIAVLLGKSRLVLGHIPRGMAKRLSREIDRGVRWGAYISRVEHHPDHPDHPGVWLQLERRS